MATAIERINEAAAKVKALKEQVAAEGKVLIMNASRSSVRDRSRR